MTHRFITFEESSCEELEILEVPAVDPRSIEDQLLQANANLFDAEATSMQGEIQTFSDAVTALESLESLIQSNLTNDGGLDATSAAAIQISLEHISNTLKIPNSKLSVSLESFSVSPRASSEIALESVQAKIAGMWQALVNGIKRAIQWLLDLIQRWSTSLTSLQGRAKALEHRVNQLGHWDKASVIYDDTLRHRLTVPGKQPNQVVDEFKFTVAFLLSLSDGVSQACLKALANLERLMSSPTVDEGLITQLKETVMGVLNTTVTDKFKASSKLIGNSRAVDGTTPYLGPMLLGGVRINALVPNDFSTVSEFSVQKEFVDVPSWKELPALNVHEVRLIIKTVYGVHNYQASIAPFVKVLKDLIQRVGSLSNFSNAAEKTTGENGAALRGSIKVLLKAATAVPSIASGTLLASASAMLRLAEVSVPTETAGKELVNT